MGHLARKWPDNPCRLSEEDCQCGRTAPESSCYHDRPSQFEESGLTPHVKTVLVDHQPSHTELSGFGG